MTSWLVCLLVRARARARARAARALVARWVEHYNTVRLHSAIGCVAPADFLAGRSAAIWATRDRKLEAARDARAARRAAASCEAA